jgi:alpha-1,3-rhamnosyl/mannosyltransferase
VSLKKLCQANHLVAISEFTKKDVVSRLGVDPECVTAVPLAIDPKAFTEPDKGAVEGVRERYRLPERYVLYVGSLETHKRVPLAIEAAARAKAPLVIVGRHSGGQRQQLAETVERLRADPFVRYLGYVPAEHLSFLYGNARAFVFPSVYEGFGLPILEAMTARCPVVTTSAASLPEVAGDAALVLPPDNLEALVGAVSEIAEDDDLRERLIEAGARRASLFTWKETAKRTVEVYERVLEGKP